MIDRNAAERLASLEGEMLAELRNISSKIDGIKDAIAEHDDRIATLEKNWNAARAVLGALGIIGGAMVTLGAAFLAHFGFGFGQR